VTAVDDEADAEDDAEETDERRRREPKEGGGDRIESNSSERSTADDESPCPPRTFPPPPPFDIAPNTNEGVTAAVGDPRTTDDDSRLFLPFPFPPFPCDPPEPDELDNVAPSPLGEEKGLDCFGPLAGDPCPPPSSWCLRCE